jgi:DNA processing protein
MTSALTAPDRRAALPTTTPGRPRHPSPEALRESAATLLLSTQGAGEPHAHAHAIEQEGSALGLLIKERLAAAPQTSFFEDPEAAVHTELAAVEARIREWRFQGTQLVTVLDEHYPANLRAVAHRPPLLFVAGRLKPRDATAIAIIGSPEAGTAEIRAAETIATRLAQAGHTVMSGLSAGAESAAHLAALKRGGRTIAVIATGLALCYPRANVILQRRIAAECAVVSPFLPETSPSAATMAERIPVMAGMATATIVVAANPLGTIRNHAQLAADQQRPVILLESVLRHKWARELAEHPAVTVAAIPADAVAAVDLR